MSESNDSISKLLALISEGKNQEKIVKTESIQDDDLIKQFLIKKMNASENLSKEDKVDLLCKRYKTFLDKYTFEVGMLVSWKQGLKNKGVVAYGEPAIVVDYLAEPIFDEERGAGSPYFMEPLDLVQAFLDEDNDFMIFYADSRRFMPYRT
ncbi:hypothetical protein SIO17_07415 [Pseudoalteromonas piscicida]|uniref:Uncharacterized protein n=1 Tax=Pseudoalteromonas piscicida TaxID=43662 RepID=A0ABN5CIX6_PSEO7|nr:hypothetical protein [Pseudoalteromonas piscicida]ATD06859.1 hypothetical protein PPIS_a1781 [Pseudoalteromonas piscicida]ATD06862.1 hypothetical protein PPIS_a1784 [Pseudoalteromonas piscicida]WPU33545.1 hypothetical protein SIO17_07405 [Pseudoalteromonas piscicida]WPU33547.1 hypothetical protein SIO17_07415 [Pseudoalteromonas piscicida]